MNPEAQTDDQELDLIEEFEREVALQMLNNAVDDCEHPEMIDGALLIRKIRESFAR